MAPSPTVSSSYGGPSRGTSISSVQISRRPSVKTADTAASFACAASRRGERAVQDVARSKAAGSR
jgi:hypothetical protein